MLAEFSREPVPINMASGKRWLRRSVGALLALLLILYPVCYMALRASGAISARAAQGYFELEFGGGDEIVPVFPARLVLLFWPLMWAEQPFLKYYTDEPTGG